MKSIILSLVLALPVSALVAAPTAKHTNKTIIAGKSIGDIHVGERLSKVEARRGMSPDYDVSSGRVSEPWTVPGGTLEAQAYREHTVLRVRTTSPLYRTKNGIHVGSKLSEVRARYPHAKFTPDSTRGPLLSDDTGIDFEFDSEEGSSSCIAIRVYQP